MSTRADFYVGRGLKARYVGSIGHDAWPQELAKYFEGVRNEAQFLAALENVFAVYGGIRPEFGWPWPWKSSETTDTVICLHGRRVWTKHWSKRWAPLERYSHPSRARCFFADMTRGPQTAERKLRERIRTWCRSFQVRLDQDVLGAFLVRFCYGLTRYLMHSHVRPDGQPVMLRPFSNTEDTLRDCFEVLRREAESVRELVAQRQRKEPNPVWDVLLWGCDAVQLTWHGNERVSVQYDYDLPMYFAQGTPRVIPRNTLPEGAIEFEPLDRALHAQAQAHLQLAWKELPFIYGYAVVHEVGFMKGKHLAQDLVEKHDFLADGSTPENRDKARAWGAERFWDIEVPGKYRLSEPASTPTAPAAP